MPWVISGEKKRPKCAVPYGKALSGGRYQCWWCKRVFTNKAGWAKHASGR